MKKFLDLSLIAMLITCISTLLTFLFSFILEFLMVIFKFIQPTNIIHIFTDYFSMLNYLLNPFIKHLNLKYYQLSSHGYSHFVDVKHLIIGLEVLVIILIIIFNLIWKYRLKNNTLWEWKNGIYMLKWIGMPVGFSLAANFNYFFITFHKLVFHNNYWLFNPDVDTVIKILPVQLFMAGSVMILGLYELLLFILDKKIDKEL